MSRKTPRQANLRRAVVQTLESLESAGVKQIDRKLAAKLTTPAAKRGESAKAATARPATPRASAAPQSASRAASPAPAAPTTTAPQREKDISWSGAALPLAKRVDALAVVQTEVAACRQCKELASTRTQTVFGVGDPQARLVFIGEAPGADEDQQGVPFVGRAGQLLTKIIEACTLNRAEVYILNVLKCRPPGNRTPLPDEVENCRGFLERQLQIIRPEFICCLGAVASRSLLDLQLPMGKLRGNFYKYGDANVLCTYHPSYLLRNPAAKKDVWEDMKLLMQRMGVKLP